MARDPKKKFTENRKRFLTIHDGTRLTPAVVAVLEAIVDLTHEGLEARAGLDDCPAHQAVRVKSSGHALEVADPVLVTRSDGLAIYVSTDGVIA